MFEKEAEEIANKKLCATTMCYNHCNFNSPKHHRCGDWHRCYEIAKEGAEFGYNKANEWHYVKDGDLPKEFDKPYLCKVNAHFEVGYFMAYKEQPWHFDEYYLDNEDVIAWKEIVLPKE